MIKSCSHYTVTVLPLVLTAAASVGAAPSFWDQIYGPVAPSPKEGSPLAAHESQEKSLLPAQISAIVGAYLFTVLVLLLLLLTVGRRLRRAAQSSEKKPLPDVEMIKPKAFDPSPISPSGVASNRSWREPWSPTKVKNPLKKSNNVSLDTTPTSPGVDSLASFDQATIELDRLSRQKEMERLYAAVMEHDAKQAKVIYAQEDPSVEQLPTHEVSRERTPDSQKSGRRPPPILTVMPSKLNSVTPASPMSPGNMTAPIKPGYPQDLYPLSNRAPASARAAAFPPTPTSPRHMVVPGSPSSIPSKAGSTSSMTSKARKGLRNMRLSAMRPKAGSRDPRGESDDVRTPLSTHFNQANSTHSVDDHGSVPTTPGTAMTADYRLEELDRPQPLPRPAPQRGLSASTNPYEPASLNPQQPMSANTSSSTLPLRSLTDGLRSPATKTTFVERRPNPSAMLSPRTGIPATPYSAYMPFSPVTPVTPHLVTRQERKAMQKNAGRKVATEEDAVMDEKDLWDSGY